jgi:uroporphyrinogen decarboxylase
MPQKIFRLIDQDAAKEEIDTLFRYAKPKRVPNGSMWAGQDFSIQNTGKNIAEIFDNPQAIFDAVCWTAHQYHWNPFIQVGGFSALGCFDFGGSMSYPTKNGEYFTQDRHPVSSEKDVEKLNLPDPYTAGDIPRQLRFGALQKEAGFPVTFMTRSPFCMAANMCALNLFMTWMIEAPSLCKQLMELGYRHTLRTLDVWIETFGVDNLQVWLTTPIESNQLISPKHMETFALPFHLKYGEHLKKIGIKQRLIHFCGDQNRNLPILAEADPWAHPAILSFGSEVDILRAADLFPRDIIYGNVDTVLLDSGSPREIYDTCKGLLEKGKRIEGGFILAPSCDAPVFMPPVNMYAMTKAIEEHGIY